MHEIRELRQDQQDVKAGVYNGWNSEGRVGAAIMPTGTGKSVVYSSIATDVNQSNSFQLSMAHRNELVGQLSMHLANSYITHRVIAPKDFVADLQHQQREEFGQSFINPDAYCGVGSIDTIVSRLSDLKSYLNNIAYWFGDEGHHFLRNNKWGRVIDAINPNSYGLLLTACPARADGKGLGRHASGYADFMVKGLSFKESIGVGITDYELVIAKSDFEIDDSEVGKDGDFTTNKMKKASQESRIVGNVVDEYIKYAYGKRGICFATDVETATDMAKSFNERGVAAAVVHGKTPSNVRRDMIKRFKSGKILMLVNVDLFDEGFDVPACEVVIMARPTASLNKYLQMCGRALRKMAGKLYGLIIDHVSNWKRHGLPCKHRDWTLDDREKATGKKPADPEEEKLTECTECSRPYLAYLPRCSYCGAEPELPEPAKRTIQHVQGDMILLDRAALEAMRQQIELESPESVANRVAHVAGEFAGKGAFNKAVEKAQAHQELFDTIALWAGHQRGKGRDDRESHKRIYLATGMTIYDMLHRDRSRADYQATTEMIRGWL